MKLGMFTVMMSDQPLEKVLDLIAGLGLEAVELGTGGFVGNAHCNLDELLSDGSKLRQFKRMVSERGVFISALSCHGNPLHPDPQIGPAHAEAFRKSILLAEQLEVSRIIGFAGCPAGCETDRMPNWVHEPWPEWFPQMLEWQWQSKLIPFWREMAQLARRHNVKHFCFELHPGDMVYNPESLFRLREAVGQEICCNYDPSNIEWQGIDTLAVIPRLGDTIRHVHAKDSKVYRRNASINGTLDPKPYRDELNRSWNFRTVGWGHGPEYWKEFVLNLRMIGYDDVLSIEHEDSLMSAGEGLDKAVQFLNTILLKQPPGPMTWA
jgi:sugar phosphate isomerase/epimerase